MLRRSLSLLSFLAATSVVALSSSPALANEKAPPLLLMISIDGFRADYLHRGLSPTLDDLAENGAYAKAMRPSFPTLTFPNHYTLVTGKVPNNHGIIANQMVDPAIEQRFSLGNRDAVQNPAWWNDAQPIWNTAREAGLKTATMFWPGSEAQIRGHQPHYWRSFDMTLSAADRVKQVLEWIDLPVAERPNFITLYFDEVDHKGHVTGHDSEDTYHAIRQTDAAISQLIEGLKARNQFESTNLLVVSDHGMANTDQDKAIVLDDLVPVDAFEFVSRGAFAQINARAGKEDILDAVLSQPIPHMNCWRGNQTPERFRFGSHARVTRWVCMGDEGWTLYDRAVLTRFGVNPGSHGFDPELESMAAIFIATGPDIRPGARLGTFENTAVYPLLARLLRITPEAHDGDADATLALMHPNADFSVR